MDILFVNAVYLQCKMQYGEGNRVISLLYTVSFRGITEDLLRSLTAVPNSRT